MAISFAPRRGSPDHVSPTFPKSLVQHAEQVVIERAREYIRHLEREDEPATTPADARALQAAVRVLDTIKKGV